MSNIVSSAIFCARNVDKTENGQIGRSAVAVGQGAKVVDYVTKLDNTVGKTAKTAVDALQTAAKSEGIFKFAGKAVDFASKNVNPLICVSSGIDVLMSDDKESAIVTNATAVGSMFGAEHLMKNHMDKIPKIKCLKGVSEKILKFSKETKGAGKLPAIINGTAFVVGSVVAYNAGEKFGKLLLGKNEEPKSEVQSAKCKEKNS